MITLEQLLPFGYVSGGNLLDIASTAVHCARNGTDDEENNLTRGLMEKHGVGKGLVFKCLTDQTVLLCIGACAYVVDRLLGIEGQLINLHKSFLYGFGTYLYIVFISNCVVYVSSLTKKDPSA